MRGGSGSKAQRGKVFEVGDPAPEKRRTKYLEVAMPTIQQLIRKPRLKQVKRNKVPAMQQCPQKRGVCTRVYTTTPKKPNSALRKVAKIRLNEWLRSNRLYPGRGSQSAGALGGADPRRASQGPSRRALSYHPRRPGYAGCSGAPSTPFEVRCETSEMKSGLHVCCGLFLFRLLGPSWYSARVEKEQIVVDGGHQTANDPKGERSMSRRHRAEKREVNPDPKFHDLVLSKFMNAIMRAGKKSTAERIVYGALDRMEDRAKQDPMQMFHQALENVMPAVEVRSRRVGGATYQVPVEVRNERRQALAIRWIINAARARNENTMVDRLSGELLDAANNRGTAVKKREDTHKMADANRAFSHYRW